MLIYKQVAVHPETSGGTAQFHDAIVVQAALARLVGIGKRQGEVSCSPSVQRMEDGIGRDHLDNIAAVHEAHLAIVVSLANVELLSLLHNTYWRPVPRPGSTGIDPAQENNGPLDSARIAI